MKPGYYWVRPKDMPNREPEPARLSDGGFFYVTGLEEYYEAHEIDLLGRVLPYRAPVARIQSPYTPDGKVLVSFRVNVPAAKNNGSAMGGPWSWIVRAYNTRQARKVLCQTFNMYRTPHGTTFERIHINHDSTP